MDRLLTVRGRNADDHSRRKRGRPPKGPKAPTGVASSSPLTSSQRPPKQVQTQIQTPQLQPQTLPQQTNVAPPHTSPPAKTTPTKPLVKALPTVRDHTTD